MILNIVPDPATAKELARLDTKITALSKALTEALDGWEESERAEAGQLSEFAEECISRLRKLVGPL